jgi:DNA-binding FadR family transcriptional regulator
VTETETSVRSYQLPSDAVARGRHEIVVNQLGLMIASRELAEGEQIIPEEVGEQLGVSRTVVREALRVLQTKGMLRPRPKIGTRVLPADDWNLLDPDVIGWRVRGPDRDKQLSDLMDLRVAVEVFAVRDCCTHAADDDIAAIFAEVDRMQDAAAAADHHAFTQADVAYHERLLQASGNKVFRQFTVPFAAILQAREELDILPETVSETTIEVHRRVVEAIRDRDPDRAELLAREMIEQARTEVSQWLAEEATAR